MGFATPQATGPLRWQKAPYQFSRVAFNPLALASIGGYNGLGERYETAPMGDAE